MFRQRASHACWDIKLMRMLQKMSSISFTKKKLKKINFFARKKYFLKIFSMYKNDIYFFVKTANSTTVIEWWIWSIRDIT
jgi:hypothetical protein